MGKIVGVSSSLPLSDYASFAARKQREIAGIPEDYEDIADRYRARTESLSDLIGEFGTAQREDIAADRDKAQAKTKQSLAQRGLSTATGDFDRGIEQDYQRNIRGAEDVERRQRMDYLSALTGEELQARAAVPASRLDVARSQFAMGSRPYELQAGINRSTLSRLPSMLSKAPDPEAWMHQRQTTSPYQRQTTEQRRAAANPPRQFAQPSPYAGMGGSGALQYAGSLYGF